ncbi:MAG: nucleotidyltransferase family protein, partial [Acutalibacteraceae bacterium]|nr:nucleotidyltransferase family protein [Acutalibacteraceae bacterium]
MLNSQALSVLSLIKSGIYGNKPTIANDFNIQPVYSFAKKHQIMGIMLYGLLAAGLSPDAPVMETLYSGALMETVLHEKQQFVITRLYEGLSKNKISYMPLKGALLKELYPREEMRVMSDVDILIRMEEYDTLSKCLKEMGFEEQYESDHELVWKKNDLTVEFHKHLIPSYNSDYYGYFERVWDRAVLCEGSRFALDRNDEFIYNFTHLAKHYRDGGIGVKHYIDLWLMLEKYSLDMEYIREELTKLHLERFFDNVMKTLRFWFAEGECDETVELILRHTFASGAYGSEDAHVMGRVALNVQIKQSRFGAVLRMVFPPVSVLHVTYKYLDKCPV